jgi:hypothetical protein
VRNITILLSICVFLLGGCLGTTKVARTSCPPEDVMYGHNGCGDSYMWKDFFSEKNKGSHWLPLEEHKKKKREKNGL